MSSMLILAVMLVGQLFSMEEVLPVQEAPNTIRAAWISEEHFKIENLAAITGVGNLEEAKAIWLGQQDFARRILFFNEEGQLFATGTCGPMPFHVYPATQGEEGAYQFADNQTNIPQAYRNLLVGTFTVEDLFEKPKFTPGLTWRIRQIDSEGNPQEISALSPFVKIEDPFVVAQMHKTAFALPRLPLKDLGRPSLYVAMVRAIPGITEQDFGSDLTLSTELYDYYPGDDYKYHLLTGVFL